MKLRIVMALIAFSTSVAQAATAKTAAVAVQNVFVPSTGYDDNDSVEIVVDGLLPNTCFHAERTVVTPDANNKFAFTVEQRATQTTDGQCADNGKDLPAAMQSAVPYTADVTLGRLAAGTYTVRFNNPQATTQTFTVTEATTSSVDAMPYARVSNALVNDITAKTSDVLLTLAGTLSSSCMSLNKNVNVEKVNDVVVVRPTVNLVFSTLCMQFVRNFGDVVNLGKMQPGRYLAHVRSQNGLAVNRMFSVVEKED